MNVLQRSLLFVLLTLGMLLRVYSQHKPELILPVGHTEDVKSIDISPNQEYILTTSIDRTLKIWNLKTGQLIKTLYGHSDEINVAFWSMDGKNIISASDDKTIIVWEVETGEIVFNITEHKEAVKYANWTPDGNRFYSLSRDGIINIWDASSGQFLNKVSQELNQKRKLEQMSYSRKYGIKFKEKKTQNFFTDVDWSPDSKYIVTMSLLGHPMVFMGNTGELVFTLDHTVNLEDDLSFSQDGKKILITSNNSVYVWDIYSGKKTHTFYPNHTKRIKNAVISPDGNKLLTISYDNSLLITDVGSGMVVQHFTFSSSIQIANWSNDSKQIATVSENNSYNIWQVNSGQLDTSIIVSQVWSNLNNWLQNDNYLTIQLDKFIELDNALNKLSVNNELTNIITNALWSKNDSIIYMTNNNNSSISLINSLTGRLINTIQEHKDNIECFEISPDGNLFSTSDIKSLNVWHSGPNKLLHSIPYADVYIISWSPDSKSFLTCDWNNIYSWDAIEGSKLQLFETGWGGYASPKTAHWSNDGKCVLVARDESAKNYNASTGELINEFIHSSSSILGAKWSQDNDRIVTFSFDNTAKIWDVNSGELMHLLDKHIEINEFADNINDAIWFSDGSKIITIANDNTAKIWNVETGKLKFDLIGHKDWVEWAELSLDNTVLYTHSKDGELIMWNTASGKRIGSVNPIGEILDVSWDKNLILSQFNTEVSIHNIKDGNKLLSFFQISESDWIITHPSGFFDASEGAMEKIYFSYGLEIHPAQNYLDKFYRPGLWEMIMRGETIN